MIKEKINEVLDVIESNKNLADNIKDLQERGEVLAYLYGNGYITKPQLEKGGIGNKYQIASARNVEVLRRP